MKTLTLLSAIVCFTFLITNNSNAQTSYINTKNVTLETSNTMVAASLKINTMMIAEGIIKVKMVNQPVGVYSIQLTDADAKVISTTSISHETESNTELVNFGKTLKGGAYKIVITKPDNSTSSEKVMLLM